MPSTSPKSGIRFGAFEVQPQSGELRKHGIRIKLQDQPCKILLALLEKPGEVVTREELRRRIWGDDTFVDFDHGLSAAVNRLREALSDSAENPRYIETMARRGYRFIAPVEGAAQPGTPPAERKSSMKLVWAAAGLLIVGGLAVWLASNRAAKPAPRVVPLTSLAGFEIQPTFSPDGSQVAFAWDGEKQDNQDIYVKMVGSATESRLTSAAAEDEFPSWSPDGTTIAFGSRRGASGIYVVSPLGGPERKIADLPALSRPAWLPDGKHLVVWSRLSSEPNNGPGGSALFLVPVEGGGRPRPLLMPNPGTRHTHPAIAADGSLAFVSCAGSFSGPMCHIEVVAMTEEKSPRGEPRRITKPLGWITGLTWAADSSAVIMVAYSDSERSTYLHRVRVREAAEPQRLEVAGSPAFDPAIDRTRNRLAFTRSTAQADIWRWELGGQPSAFLRSSRVDSNPQFSSDGRRVAFHSRRSGDETAIWIANAEGSDWVQITKGLSFSGSPRWSPDDRWIAFDSQNQNRLWDIWKVESSGGPPQRLTQGPASNFIPSWSRDGKWIYFASDRSGRNELWRMAAEGGPAEQVTRNGGHVAFESADGTTLYYTKSNAGVEGLFSVPVAGGAERQVLKDEVPARGFVVVREGIYYVSPEKPSPGDRATFLYSAYGEVPQSWNRCEIRFHEFSSGRNRVVGEIGGPISLGLTVSPDGKTFLYSRYAAEADLFMIENFR